MTAVASTLTDAQVIGLAKGAGWIGSDVVIADAVAHAESGLNPLSVNTANKNGTTDYGLMQINSSHVALLQSGDWRDPAQNMRMAFQVWKSQGWHAWSSYNNGSYSKFMPVALASSGAPAIQSLPGAYTATPASLGGTISGIGDFVKTVLDPRTYLRAGMFIAGLFLVFIALIGFSRAIDAVTKVGSARGLSRIAEVAAA
ncbi:MAG TPA: transglycosylase SLT domain-containing protein [Arthrobacter sp.]|nr:transglycosylase SLT domain-containing protein [Arthrobacter sp.]